MNGRTQHVLIRRVNSLGRRVAALETQDDITGGGTINGNVTITGTLTVTGAPTLNGFTTINNGVDIIANQSSDALYIENKASSGDWMEFVNFNGVTLFRGTVLSSGEPSFTFLDNSSSTLLHIRSGGVYVGGSLTSSAKLFDVQTNVADYIARFYNDGNASSRHGFEIQAGQDSNPSCFYITFRTGNRTSSPGYIGGDGAGGVGYNSSSDERLKDIIGDIPEQDAKALLNVITPKRYRGKGQPHDAPVNVGFLANEVAQHTEGVASLDESGFYQMDYSRMTPYIWRVLQMHEQRLTALEAA